MFPRFSQSNLITHVTSDHPRFSYFFSAIIFLWSYCDDHEITGRCEKSIFNPMSAMFTLLINSLFLSPHVFVRLLSNRRFILRLPFSYSYVGGLSQEECQFLLVFEMWIWGRGGGDINNYRDTYFYLRVCVCLSVKSLWTGKCRRHLYFIGLD